MGLIPQLSNRPVGLLYGTLPAVTVTDRRLQRGERTRAAALDAAMVLATEVGLDGLSLSQLAQRLGISKSALFAHWPDKQALQLATVERARDQWVSEIVTPALAHPPGVRRLWALHTRRLAYYRRAELPGGCFFAKVGFEYGLRPGPVRDRIVEILDEWHQLLVRTVTEAVASGELASVPAAQFAFEIDALAVAAVYQARLRNPDQMYDLARQAALDRIRPLCNDPSLLPEE